MKKGSISILFLVIWILFFHSHINAQAPDWIWAKNVGGNYDEFSNSVTTDVNGSVYTTGSFSSLSITIGSTILNRSNGSHFLVKYDGNGNVIWAKNSNGNFACLTTDASGNLYAMGSFYINSSPIIFGNDTIYCNGGYDVLLVKYDANGNVLWAKSAGGESMDLGFGVSTDANDFVYLTGSFDSPSIIYGQDTLINTSFRDVFLAKYDSSGNVIWAKCGGGNGSVAGGQSVKTDINGNIYIVGSFASPSISFGSCTLYNTNNSGNSGDLFLVKYSGNGNVIWAKSAEGSSGDMSTGVTTDPDGNVYITGSFSSPFINFDTCLINTVGKSLFLVKYDGNGDILWAKGTKGGGDNTSSAITSDTHGDIYITGSYSGTSITFGSFTLTHTGTYEVFLTEYDCNGQVIWAKSVGVVYDSYSNSVSIDTNGNVYITGDYNSSSISFGSDVLYNAGDYDVFVAKLKGVETGCEEFQAIVDTVKIYPNPASNNLTLEAKQKSEIEILNITGQVIKRLEINDNHTNIDISYFSNGMYFLTVKHKDGLSTMKFIKE